MVIETPSIFLSFDDFWIDEWHDTLPLFVKYGVLATFYLAFSQGNNVYDMTPERWKKLKEIEDAGHAIGYHGWNHLSADVVIRNKGCQGYLESEVYPGLERMAKHGFYPKHFCYPYGHCNEESHACLLEHFDTLRGYEIKDGEKVKYAPEEVKSHRVLDAFDIRDNQGEWQAIMTSAINEKKVGFFFAHNPSAGGTFGKVRELVVMGKRHGVKFYPMSVLDR